MAKQWYYDNQRGLVFLLSKISFKGNLKLKWTKLGYAHQCEERVWHHDSNSRQYSNNQAISLSQSETFYETCEKALLFHMIELRVSKGIFPWWTDIGKSMGECK